VERPGLCVAVEVERSCLEVDQLSFLQCGPAPKRLASQKLVLPLRVDLFTSSGINVCQFNSVYAESTTTSSTSKISVKSSYDKKPKSLSQPSFFFSLSLSFAVMGITSPVR
jgi:hypothetical protein